MQHNTVMRSLCGAGFLLALAVGTCPAAQTPAPAIEKLNLKVAIAVTDAWGTAEDAQKAAVLASINNTLSGTGVKKATEDTQFHDFPDGTHFQGQVSAAGIGLGTLTGGLAQDFVEYRGRLKGSVFQGDGVLIRKDGTRWIGRFQNGRQTGYGARYDAKGGVAEQGLYEAGRLKTPLRGL